MKRKSIWPVLALLIVTLAFGLASCKKKHVTEYTLSETEIALTVGETKELTISPAPEGSVTWTSDAPEVATVEGGTVTAVKAGTANVSAAIEGAETPLTCKVTVNAKQGGDDVTETTYKLETSEISIKTTETFQLKVLDPDGAEVTSGMTFTSENPAVATVSASGLVTGVAVGSTSVKVAVGGETLTATVNVGQKYTFTLTPNSLDIAAGAKATLTLNSTPALPEGSRPHTFTSSDPAVATVNGGSGEVTGVAKGTAVITCSVEGQEVKANVTVTEYTVKIGGVEMTDDTTMRVGDEALAIEVTADPASHAVEATYASSNENAVTIVDGNKLHAVAAGSSIVTVTVGGREFKTTVTVQAGVLYTLKVGDDEIEDEGTVTLNVGDEKEISVMRDPEGTVTLTIDITDSEGVLTKGSNTITAAKVGTASVKVTVTDEHATTTDPIEFEFTVNVVLTTTLTAEDFTFGEKAIDLTYLDANKTLDWYKYWFNNNQSKARMKDNANLISDYTMASGVTDEEFWDYPVPVIYDDADGTKAFGGNTYGRAVHGSYTLEIKLTNQVTKVILLTGAWKEAPVVEFKIGDIVLQSNTINAPTDGENPASLARGLTLTIKPSEIPAEGLTLTISVNCVRQHGGNASIVAAAVIGNTAHDHAATAETEINIEKSAGGEFNLTELGNLDWAAVKEGGVYRKAGVPENSIIKANAVTYRDPETGTFGNDYGKDEGKNAHFTWTDGTENAPADLHNFMWSNDFASIPVALTKGNFTVTLFVTGWSSAYMVGVYDKNGTFIQGKQVTPTTHQGITAKVTITLTVKEAGDYTFKVIKLRDSNCGWAAIAVSQNSEYSIEQSVFDLAKGDTTEHSIVVKKGEETVSEGVTYSSSSDSIVTVADGGKLTLGSAVGTATITVTIGEEQFLVYVTVTEYTITSGEEVTLSAGKTAQIEISANPNHAINASYAVTSGQEHVEVTEGGVIKANSKGEATVTVTIDGKVFTITVHVVEYVLDKQNVTLTLGSEDTGSVKMTAGEGGGDVEGVKYTSDDDSIATVNEETGEIAAQGFGKTTIKATKDGVVLECTVIVKLTVTPTEKDYADGSNETVNLDELDDENVTLDWHFFRNDNVHEMANGDLIGNLSTGRTSTFGDYRTHITWYNGDDKEKASYFGYTDGWTFSEGVSFNVKVTKDVKYIAIFTGAYHAKNTVTISYDGVEYAKFEFSNEGDNDGANKNKQVIFTPDIVHFGEEEKTFTITLTVGEETSNHWSDNISLVAIAVVGNTARGAKTTATAEENHTITSGGDAVDLTAVGTLDWAYICDGDNGLVTKSGDSHVIHGINCIGGQGGGGEHFANQSFTWSNGTNTTTGTDKFKWCDNVQAICVDITQNATVTLWISAWNKSVDLTVYDKGNEIIATSHVITGTGNSSQGVKVEVSVTATEATTLTFFMKVIGEGQGNFGLGAIAVANAE